MRLKSQNDDYFFYLKQMFSASEQISGLKFIIKHKILKDEVVPNGQNGQNHHSTMRIRDLDLAALKGAR